jgi:hypothetical protein
MVLTSHLYDYCQICLPIEIWTIERLGGCHNHEKLRYNWEVSEICQFQFNSLLFGLAILVLSPSPQSPVSPRCIPGTTFQHKMIL